MTPADVTAIVVNWNGERYLERCLGALAAQTLPPRRVIVVDNASADASARIVRERFPQFELVEAGDNLGFAAANNRAAHMACGAWIATLNPDAFPDPDWLERLLSAADRHPDCASFACRMAMDGPGDRLDGEGDAYHLSGLAWRRHHGLPADESETDEVEVFSPCAGAALYRRDAFLDAGGFDEDYFCYFEDVDLGFRLRLLGHRCLYVPDARVIHVGSGLTGRHSDFATYHGHRNLVWTYVKDMPPGLFWCCLPLHLALNLFTLLWFALQGRGRVIFAAKRDALKGIPNAWRKRRAIQARRRCTATDLWRLMDKGLTRR